jgi:hypothetical protein
MRILFLDVDGVLNSRKWWAKRPEAMIQPTPEDRAKRDIDPDAVAALEQIVQRSGARVVVSSSWRAMVPLTVLNQAMRYRGFTGLLLGATPEADILRREGERLGVEHASRPGRGAEIFSWLRLLCGAVGTRHHDLVGPRDYVILDDEEVAGHGDRLFRTDFETGLTVDHVDAVMKLFGDGSL